MKFDYSKLKGRITEVFGTCVKFAESLGKTNTYVSLTLNNRRYLQQNEVVEWANKLCIADDDIGAYFYAKIVHETEQEGGI